MKQHARFLSVLGGFWLVATASGCGSKGGGGGAGDPRDPKNHVRNAEARQAALRMTHAEVARRLGSHRWEAKHHVQSLMGTRPEQTYIDRYLLTCGKKQRCWGRLNNSLEYGLEFVQRGDQTWFRQRYQRFMKFAEEPDAAALRRERLWGVGAAIVELVGWAMELRPDGEEAVQQRSARRYVVHRRGRRPPSGEVGGRAWRQSITVQNLNGAVSLDAETGVPLKVQLSYVVTAPKQGRRVTIRGNFDGAVAKLARDPDIAAPKDFTVARPRERELRQLRRLLPGQRLNPGYFRGGGPRAARARSQQGGRSFGAVFSEPDKKRPRPAPMARPGPARPKPGKP